MTAANQKGLKARPKTLRFQDGLPEGSITRSLHTSDCPGYGTGICVGLRGARILIDEKTKAGAWLTNASGWCLCPAQRPDAPVFPVPWDTAGECDHVLGRPSWSIPCRRASWRLSGGAAASALYLIPVGVVTTNSLSSLSVGRCVPDGGNPVYGFPMKREEVIQILSASVA